MRTLPQQVSVLVGLRDLDAASNSDADVRGLAGPPPHPHSGASFPLGRLFSRACGFASQRRFPRKCPNLLGLVLASPRVTPVRGQLVRLSLKLVSGPNGSSVEGPEDRVAPLSALGMKVPGRDSTEDQLGSWGVDPRMWTPGTRCWILRPETLVGRLCAQLLMSSQLRFVEPQAGWKIKDLCQCLLANPWVFHLAMPGLMDCEAASGLRQHLWPLICTPHLASSVPLEHLKTVRPASGLRLCPRTVFLFQELPGKDQTQAS